MYVCMYVCMQRYVVHVLTSSQRMHIIIAAKIVNVGRMLTLNVYSLSKDAAHIQLKQTVRHQYKYISTANLKARPIAVCTCTMDRNQQKGHPNPPPLLSLSMLRAKACPLDDLHHPSYYENCRRQYETAGLSALWRLNISLLHRNIYVCIC